MRYLLPLFLVLAAMVVSCKDSDEKAVETLMTEIRAEYDNGNDKAVLAAIDTLRQRYPKAIDARNECIAIYQNASLRMARTELAATDSLLERAKAEYDAMKQATDAKHDAGTATAEEFTATTKARIRRDSLQARFDVLCAEIKYIIKRQRQEAERAPKK